jgi:hypothetical protein
LGASDGPIAPAPRRVGADRGGALMADRAMQRAMVAACFGRIPDGRLTAGLGELLRESGVAADDADAILGASPRFWLYRRLVRGNLLDIVQRMMPRARARINEAAGGAFDAVVDAFLEEVGPRTHHLRDVPTEVLAWASPRWAADPAVPKYAIDLAVYELAEFQMGVAVGPAEAPPVSDVVVDRPLSFAETKRLLTLEHAVHELPEAVADRTVARAERTHLLAYRDAADVVRFLHLTPLAAAILERLFDGQTLAEALPSACASQGAALSDGILADTASLLADLAERGVFLGALA